MTGKTKKKRNLNFQEQGYKLAIELFGTIDFAASKAKNCSIGFPCSNTCISTAKTCRNKLTGNPQNFGQWIIAHIEKGGKLTKAQADTAKAKGYFDGLKPTPPDNKSNTNTTPEQSKTPDIKALQAKKDAAVAEVQKQLDTVNARHSEVVSQINKIVKSGRPDSFALTTPLTRELGSLSKKDSLIYRKDQLERQLTATKGRSLESFGDGQKITATYSENDLRKPLNDAEKKQVADIVNGTHTDAKKYFSIETQYSDKSSGYNKNPAKAVDTFINTFIDSATNQKLGLSKEQAAVIYSYTANGYVGMNAATRMQFKDPSTDVGQASVLMTRAMNEAMDKLPSYKQPGAEYATTHRGTKLPKDMVANEYIPGAIVTLRGFTSTTTNAQVTEEYLKSFKDKTGMGATEKAALQNFGISTQEKTKQGDFGRLAKEFGLADNVQSGNDIPVKYTIESKNGKRLPLSAKPSDEEVVFKSNTKFEVLESKFNREKGYHEVSLREVG